MFDQDVLEYAGAGKSWEAEGVARAERSERRAWLVAGAASIIAVLLGGGIFALLPLKEVDPFIVRVDKNTGAADIITRVTERNMSPDEAIDKYWIATYVRARESYSESNIVAYYKTVDLLSSLDEGQEYQAAVSPDNPKSVLNVYGPGGKVEVKILSISFLDTGTASVRFERRDVLRGQAKVSRWIATIGYKYEDPPLTEEERQINPLGFQVVDYRTDPETGVPTSSQPGSMQ